MKGCKFELQVIDRPIIGAGVTFVRDGYASLDVIPLPDGRLLLVWASQPAVMHYTHSDRYPSMS